MLDWNISGLMGMKLFAIEILDIPLKAKMGESLSDQRPAGADLIAWE